MLYCCLLYTSLIRQLLHLRLQCFDGIHDRIDPLQLILTVCSKYFLYQTHISKCSLSRICHKNDQSIPYFSTIQTPIQLIYAVFTKRLHFCHRCRPVALTVLFHFLIRYSPSKQIQRTSYGKVHLPLCQLFKPHQIFRASDPAGIGNPALFMR